MKEKLLHLKENLRSMGPILVAFSGGVDSTYLLHVAHEELGEAVQAVIGVSPSLLEEELIEAHEMAARIGVSLREISTYEMENASYAANPSNRCYFCKTELYSLLTRLAATEGLGKVCDGTNTDDLKEWRPGAQAGAENSIRSPLREAGLGKEEIRSLSRAAGLPTWDKPAMPCLSSRIPYGQPVTPEALRMIGRAEVYLRSMGLKELRVRHYTENGLPQARLEVAPAELSQLFGWYHEATQFLKELGYASVLLDLEGYRRGRLNEAARLEPQPIQLML